MLLKRLRSETADQHAAMESQLPLLDPKMPMSRYRSLLAKFYGYYSPLEERLRAGKLWTDSGYDWVARVKSPSLEADLLVLGEIPSLLPLCEDLPVLTTLPQVLGCLYVIEGATLGGQIITKHLQANLGVTPDSGGEFFSGYGDQTRQRWQVFGILLTDSAEQLNQDDAIVDSANATFKTLGDWLRRSDCPLRTNHPRPLPAWRCDRIRVREIYTNLLSNAIKYAGQQPPHVELGYLAPGEDGLRPNAPAASLGHTIFYARDNGIGIEPRLPCGDEARK